MRLNFFFKKVAYRGCRMSKHERDHVAKSRCRRLAKRVPEGFRKSIGGWCKSMLCGSPVYAKEHSFNNIRLRLCAFVLNISPFLLLDFSNLFEAVCKALEVCPVGKYSTRMNILSTGICLGVYLVSIGVIEESVLLQMRKIKIRRSKDRVVRTITFDDFLKVQNIISLFYTIKPVLEVTYLAVVSFLFYSGTRISGLIHLQLADCDFITKRILLRNQKGGKDVYVAINASLEPYLLNYLKIRTETNYSNFFINPSTGEPFTIDRIEKIIRSIHTKAGISFGGAHAYRRGFATYYASKNIPITHIQMMLGHSDINTTLLYINHNQNEVLTQMRTW